MLGALVVLGCAWLLAREVDDLEAAVRRLSAPRVALSGAAAVVGTVCIQRLWLALLGGLGVQVGRRDAAEVFYVTQLGKYVPGSVWPVLAQVQLGARWGVARRVMLAANVLLIVVVAATGILVGAVLLPWSSPEGLRAYWWLLVVLPVLVVVLHPRVVMAVIDRLLELARRERLGIRVSNRGLTLAVLWALAAWTVLGAHVVVLVSAYGPVSLLDAAAAAGGIALAWAAGLLFIPAPAGAGVREAVLVLTTSPLIGADAAVSVALASRVLLVVADVALAAGSTVVRRLRVSSA